MTTTNRNWVQLVALVLVPLLAALALIGLVGARADSAVSAAVVNLDEPVTVNGQYIPMGRQFAAAIIDRDGDNIDWTLADAPSAASGLKTGKYSVVVTIPKDFSAAATSFSANDAETAKQATIGVQVSENAPVTDAQVAQEISRLAVDTINSTLTSGYLDGIYVGFNTVGEQFTTIVDGAGQLHDGATQLADGVEAATQGATQLSAGMAQLQDNGPLLVDGGNELVDGIGDLLDGTAQLDDGADQLADGVGQFASQTPQLVGGVEQLAEGADQLLGNLPAFANGSAAAIGGVTELRKGLDAVIAGLEGAGVGDLSGLDQLASGAKGVQQGAAGLSSGLQQVSGALGGYSQGQLDDTARGVIAGVNAQFQCPVADPQTCAQLEAVFAQGVGAGFQAGTGVAAGMLTTSDPATGQSLVSGAGALATGAGQLSDGVGAAVEGLGGVGDQLGSLNDGLTKLRDGAATIETQAAPLVANAPAIAAGATELNTGIQQLGTQVGALPDGVNQLSTGARQLADGVAELDTGVGTLREGASTYVDGVSAFVDGVGSAADGTSDLTDGMVELSAGATKLSDGIGTFATELAKGADQVPSYSQNDREQLSKVVSSPVERTDSLATSTQVPLVSLLLLSGLWLGALAAFTVYRPVPRDVVASREPSVMLWLKSLWLPAAIVGGQALVLGIVGGVVLDLGVGKTIALMGVLVLLGASFVLANHALAGWLGHAGRAVSVLLLVLTIGLGISSSLAWLGPVAAVSPLQNGLELVRTWLSGGSGEVGIAAVSVLMFIVAAALSFLSISSRRRLSVDRFRQRLTRAA